MRDPTNPTPDELNAWAYDPDADSDQDFDMIVTTPEYAELLLRIADDDRCPKQLFFLDCLYRLVGSAVATEGRFMPLTHVQRLIERGASGNSSSLRRWADRANAFLENPDAFDRDAWQEGGWALDEEIWRDHA